MAKNSIRDFSATAGSNTDIQSVNIDESCPASGINNAIRELMVDLKNVSTGAVNLETPAADRLDVDNLRIDGNTISSTDTNGDITLDPNGTGAVVANSKIQFGSDAQTNITGGGASDVDLILSGDTNIRFETNTNERLRITTAGDVGIGTSSPTVSNGKGLVIADATAARLKLCDTTTGEGASDGVQLGHSGGIGFLFNHENEALQFGTNSTERMRLTGSGGNLLIGTTSDISPGQRLAVKYSYTNPGAAWESDNVNAHNAIVFKNPNGTVGTIRTAASAVQYNTSSDYRLKEAVVDMTGAIDRVKALAPKRFNFIADADTTVDGFLAHEAQAVVPEAVSGTYNEVDDDGNAVMQGIDQSKLVPLLTGALRETIAKIETLETEMTALKARVTALEA